MTDDNPGKASFWYSMKAVLWAMLGVRRDDGYNQDVAKITPIQAIIFGVIGVILFIATLITVVSLVT
jgi:hypothetical protein